MKSIRNNIPKRILFVRPTLGQGGADRVTVNILKYIDRQKFRPELALMRKEGICIDEVPYDVPVYDLKTRSLWFLVWPLIKLIKSKDYDYLYSTCGGASIPLILAVLLSGSKGPVVVSERSILFPSHRSKWKRWIIFWLKRLLYLRATYVTVVSKGMAIEILSKLKIPEEKIRIVHNPLLTDDFELKCKIPVDHKAFKNGKPVILAVGRLVHAKDYPTLIKAFAKVLGNHRATLFILGEGPLRSDLMTLAARLGISDEVVFGGFDKNPFRYMARCTVFVLSSLYEGMPGTLIQAMACGAACVSTDCNHGPSEIIENGINGLLTPVQDEECLSGCIQSLLNDPIKRCELGKNASLSVKKYQFGESIPTYFDFLS